MILSCEDAICLADLMTVDVELRVSEVWTAVNHRIQCIVFLYIASILTLFISIDDSKYKTMHTRQFFSIIVSK